MAFRITIPKIFIGSEKFAVLSEDREAHPIWVCLQNLIPAPNHIPIHVIVYSMLPAKHEVLIG